MNNNGDSPYAVKKIRQANTPKDLLRLYLFLHCHINCYIPHCLHEDHQIYKRQEAVIAEDVIE